MFGKLYEITTIILYYKDLKLVILINIGIRIMGYHTKTNLPDL